MRILAIILSLALLTPLALANDAKPGGPFLFETWIRQSDALTTTLYVDGVAVCTETVGPAELVSWEGGDINIQLEVPTAGCGPTVTLFGADWRFEETSNGDWRTWWDLHAFASTEGLPSARGVFETEWGEPGTLHAEQDVGPGMTVRWDGWFHVVF